MSTERQRAKWREKANRRYEAKRLAAGLSYTPHGRSRCVDPAHEGLDQDADRREHQRLSDRQGYERRRIAAGLPYEPVRKDLSRCTQPEHQNLDLPEHRIEHQRQSARRYQAANREELNRRARERARERPRPQRVDVTLPPLDLVALAVAKRERAREYENARYHADERVRQRKIKTALDRYERERTASLPAEYAQAWKIMRRIDRILAERRGRKFATDL